MASSSKLHNFGGDWTEQKLAVVTAYLPAYVTALKAQNFKLAYIDAFAGTGYRTARRSTPAGPLLQDIVPQPGPSTFDGSARLALQTPGFYRYIFIERSRKRCAELERLRIDFHERAEQIVIERGEANERIQALCHKQWHLQNQNRRAVLFLDPYGMQVEWETIRAVANTRAIDLWLLMPLGIGVNRLVTTDGNIPVSWQNRLDRFFGTEQWRDHFYRKRTVHTMFGDEERTERVVDVDAIGRYFNDRLRSVFAGGVANEPAVLRNSTGCPIYLLCFAVGNRKAATPALRIAEHLLKKFAQPTGTASNVVRQAARRHRPASTGAHRVA